MTPERLAEIRLDIESYEKHQRYGPHELPYRTIERLECDDFPKYVRELLAALDAQSAELAALKARLEAVKKTGLAVIDICNQESSWVEIGKRLDALDALLKGENDGNPA